MIIKRKIVCLYILLIILALPGLAKFQESEDTLWKQINESRIIKKGDRLMTPEKYLTYSLDQGRLKELLSAIPLEFSFEAQHKEVILELPTPEGKIVRFRIEESPVLAPAVAARFPNWKTFSGQGIDDPTAIARFDWSDSGFHGLVMGLEGTFLIDPYQADDRSSYVVYNKNDFGKSRDSYHCKLDEVVSGSDRSKPFPKTGRQSDFSNGANLRTYNLAIATTGEYTQFFGSQTSAFNSVVSAVNRINAVYRRDFSVQFTLISDTRTVFPDQNTDPYNNTDQTAQLTINHQTLDNIYGNANYDIGHLFGTGGGGVATSPSTCDDQTKGEGYSARGADQGGPTGDPFWVDFVAHEMGHQFSADHTYNNAESGPCSTRSMVDAFEVASGVTIMSYVGVCDARNLQQFSLDVFHIRSLTSIINYLNDNQQGGGSCGTPTATGNSIPAVAPLTNYTIPRLTPFTLTVSATDGDAGDALTYSWEQYDLAPSASGPLGTPANTYDVDTDGVERPLFRNYAPTTSPARNFPSLTYILNNSNQPPLTYMGTSPTGAVCPAGDECVTGENLPSIARTMNFRVAVRDNRAAGGGIADLGMTVTTVGGTGPFQITSQNTPVTVAGNSSQTITWNVAGTDANGINTANVKISLSTDGGQTFPTVISASTPNDGTESVTIPNTATTTARIKVEAVGNIFFDINDANFTITGVTVNTKRFFDFDGDGKTDVSIFRPGPNPAQWWYLRSSDFDNRAFGFGLATDRLVPADFTGDGKTDIAFWRETTGEWYVLRSEDSSFYAVPFGTAGDIPAPGDFDGDGKADTAVFRPSTATWFIQNSGGGTTIIPFGIAEDKPVVADYDGDGKDDIAIYRPSVNQWWLNRSTDGVLAYAFGAPGDKTVQGDYTGDGKADSAFFKPTTGEWFVLRSEDLSFYAVPFGISTDIPTPGDYDGDGRFDTAVFRPSNNTWFINGSTAGSSQLGFGIAGDIPVPNVYSVE
jgi:hypothetical protein